MKPIFFKGIEIILLKSLFFIFDIIFLLTRKILRLQKIQCGNRSNRLKFEIYMKWKSNTYYYKVKESIQRN